jgi:hypothetical protein
MRLQPLATVDTAAVPREDSAIHRDRTRGGGELRREFSKRIPFRWLQKDAVARAWYAQKIKRDGGRRARAVIALTRKFAQALFHVARGVPLDSTKLFDVSKLRLT